MNPGRIVLKILLRCSEERRVAVLMRRPIEVWDLLRLDVVVRMIVRQARMRRASSG